MLSEPLAKEQSSTANEHETPSTSAQPPRNPRQRAVSQQTSVDLSSTTSPLNKVRYSAYSKLYHNGELNRFKALFCFYLFIFNQKAVSQQISFDVSGPQLPSGRVSDF